MPRTAKPKPHQELVSYELLTALLVVLEELKDDPFAQTLAKQIKHGQVLWREGLQEEWHAQSARANDPAPDVNTLKKPVLGLTRVLTDLLKQNGLGQKVEEVKKKYTDLYDIAEHLIEAGRTADVEVAASVMDSLEKQLKPLAKATARVEAGGHPIFDDKIAAVATKLWIIVDDCFDGLRILFRNRGVSVHPIFAQEPKVKTSLRPQVGPPVAGTRTATKARKPTEKTAKGKRNVIKVDGKNGKAETGNESGAGGQPKDGASVVASKSNDKTPPAAPTPPATS